jgi:DNA invertase Pin-like site-specific DNA recombinase
MKYGYARVSTADQNLARQLKSLKEAQCDEIFKEKLSGATTNRPELKRLLETVKEGDTIIIHSLDRISRSTKDLLSLVDELKEKGVSLKSINDSWLDTSKDNPFSDLLLTIMGGLAEYERKTIMVRQKEGIELAKKKGKYKGRVKKYTEKHKGMQHAIELYKQGNKTVKEICEITKVSRSALYREIRKRDLKQAK